MPKAIAFVAALFLAGAAHADEVKWRHDYNAARREATATGRPLFLDFGSENCVWCRRLDASTFRSPNIVKMLNERFIPVKVDGNENERLTQSLGVTAFPTLVMATAEGKIIDRHGGYLDPAAMAAFLGKAPPAPQVAAPAAPRPVVADDLALARRDFEAGRYLVCLEKCRQLRGGSNAAEAERLIEQITGNPAVWQKACSQIAARLDELHPSFDAALQK